jgi:N-acetylmuramoyl-L-alanine amidase
MTGAQVYAKYKPDWFINGVMYDLKTGITITRLKDNGKQFGYLFTDEGIGVKDNRLVWSRHDDDVLDFAGGSPILRKNNKVDIEWGNRYSDYINKSHWRSVIGFDKDKVIMYVSDDSERLEAIANKLKVDYLMNLDGESVKNNGSCHLQEGHNVLRRSNRANASWILIWGDEPVKPRVVFDIGHGSDTLGKGVGAFKEHDFNSAVVVEAKKLAEDNGFEVLLTQQPYSKETFLVARTNFVNAEHAKSPISCLVSFHANASPNTSATGHGVFHWHNSINGKKLAEIWDKHAASLLGLPRWGTGIWQSKVGDWTNFMILRETRMPAVLLEHFFFTNPAELSKCNTPEFVSKCAEVVVKAICEYAGVEYKPALPDDISDWALKGRKYVVDNKISDGLRPKDNVTREELWTVIERINNK